MEHYFTNNENLRSELRVINYVLEDVPFSFTSDNGVFSKNQVDYGSLSLVETLLKNKDALNTTSALDIGCGYGFIGVTLSKMLPASFDMIDVNNRAIHLANLNSKNNKVDAKAFYSDALEGIDKKYSLIVTNPPIKAGKQVLNKILLNAVEHLEDTGSLWFVIRKDLGAKSAIHLLENSCNVEIIKRSKGFYVMMAKKR